MFLSPPPPPPPPSHSILLTPTHLYLSTLSRLVCLRVERRCTSLTRQTASCGDPPPPISPHPPPPLHHTAHTFPPLPRADYCVFTCFYLTRQSKLKDPPPPYLHSTPHPPPPLQHPSILLTTAHFYHSTLS